jgi:hypothetical protein
MVKFEKYAKDIVIIHNDRFGLDPQEQKKVLEYFKKEKPELWKEVAEHNPSKIEEAIGVFESAYINGNNVVMMEKGGECKITFDHTVIPEIIKMLKEAPK